LHKRFKNIQVKQKSIVFDNEYFDNFDIFIKTSVILDFILVCPKSEYQNQPGDVFSPSLSLNQREMPMENSPAWWVTGT